MKPTYRRPQSRRATPQQSKMQGYLLSAALIILLLFLLGWGISLIPLQLFLLVFLIVLVAIVAIAFFLTQRARQWRGEGEIITKVQPRPKQRLVQTRLPSRNPLFVPSTLQEASRMHPIDFEVFSAAVIVGLGEGHQFVAHSGRRGDRGVDFRLRNAYGQRVIGQSKCYAPHRHVTASQIRDFGGAIITHDAAYGYVVTTSTLTSSANDEKNSHGRIRTIEGPYLERLLQSRLREITQAYRDIRQQI